MHATKLATCQQANTGKLIPCMWSPCKPVCISKLTPCWQADPTLASRHLRSCMVYVHSDRDQTSKGLGQSCHLACKHACNNHKLSHLKGMGVPWGAEAGRQPSLALAHPSKGLDPCSWPAKAFSPVHFAACVQASQFVSAEAPHV